MSDDLSDEQWCILDMLMRARQTGVTRCNRRELLESRSIPQSAAVKLTWAALTMPKAFINWTSHDDFEITDDGVQIYNLRFGHGANPSPTKIADSVICLPGPDSVTLQ